MRSLRSSLFLENRVKMLYIIYDSFFVCLFFCSMSRSVGLSFKISTQQTSCSAMQVFQVATIQLVDVRRLHGDLLEYQKVGSRFEVGP